MTKKFYSPIRKVAALFLVCLVGCGNTGKVTPENGEKDEQNSDEWQDIEVVDGKVKFYLSEAQDNPRAAMGTGTRVWIGSTVTVNGEACKVQKAEDGRYYIEAKAMSSGTYNAVLTMATSTAWYPSSAYSDVRLPYSQFHEATAKSLTAYPMYASYSKETGNKLIFNDAFAVLDVAVTGKGKIASVKVEAKDDKIVAGTANFLPSRGQFTMDEGVGFAVLNCTDEGNCVQLTDGAATHFYLMVAPGEYSEGLEITVTSSDHLAVKQEVSSQTLPAGKATTVNVAFSPDDDLIFYDSFDTFVWGGDIMGGQEALGYAPDETVVGIDGGTARTGYENAFVSVPYNNPGSGFIQSNTWNDVIGKTVGTSHQMSESYIKSRNIADYAYLFRCQEYQGVLVCGAGNTSRGVIQLPSLTRIGGLQKVELSFDFCYQAGSTDCILVQTINGGMIESAQVNGKPVEFTYANSGYSGYTGKYIMDKSQVTVPSSDAASKEWQHASIVIENATDGTDIYIAGNETTAGVHGFYIDNIEVRALEAMPVGKSNLRVLVWNIQNGMWGDQHNNYDNFVAWVKKYDPDVCVWCEASTIYKDNTATGTSDRFLPDGWASVAARYGHAYTAVGGQRDNYPQVITSKYPIETLLKITDSDESGKPISHGAAIQQVNVNGKLINFVTLHLWPQQYGFGVPTADRDASAAAFEGDYYRLHEMEYICENTINSSKYASHQDWVMMGDFNSRSPYDNWFYGYAENDTKLLVHNYIKDNTNFKDIIAEYYPGYFVTTTGGNARIDYFFATAGLYDRIVNAYVITDEWTTIVKANVGPNFYLPSDHRPILVDFEMQ